MKTLDTWLNEYSDSHQNPTNKMIHNFCVPLIMWSLVAMLWSIPFFSMWKPWANWAIVLFVIAQLFYLTLGIKIFFITLFINSLFYLSVFSASQFIEAHLIKVSILVFIISWIGQFIGHKIEGKKPSFFKDIQFLLIGPLWVFHPLYRRLL